MNGETKQPALKSAPEAFAETGGTWVDNADGTATYTFKNTLTSPADRSVYRIDPGFPLESQRIKIEAASHITGKVTLWVDNQPLAVLDAPPYAAWWQLTPGEHSFWATQADSDSDATFGTATEQVSVQRYGPHAALLFVGLLGILILGARGIALWVKIPSLIVLGSTLAYFVPGWFPARQLRQWMWETTHYFLVVLPILLPAVFVIGFIQNSAWGWIYRNVYPLVGQNNASDVSIAAMFGSIMYFPILTEVPFTKALLKDNIIAVGPALALLINGPGASLSGAILIGRMFGWKKAVLYEALEMLLGGTVGLLFGKLYGDYTCPCQTGPVETFLEEPSSMAAAFILLLCIGFAWFRVRALARKAQQSSLASQGPSQ